MISPLLANAVLHHLDAAWQAQRIKLGVMVRYADDLVILCGSRERAEAALGHLRSLLTEQGLTLSETKTRLVNLRNPKEGFDFLGFHHRRVPLRRQGGKPSSGVLRWPSRKANQRFRLRVQEVLGPPARLRAEWNERRAGTC